MYFLRGSLPWQGLKATTKKQKYQRILERKQATHPDQLCRGFPPEFRDYFAHCQSLGFEDRPDYRYLKRIFRDLFERQSFEDDGVFDWDIIKRQQLAAGGDGVVELNPDGTSRPNAAPGVGDSNAPNASMNDPVYSSNAAAGGASGRDAGVGAGGDVNSRQDDSAGDGREPGARRSIISSIR